MSKASVNRTVRFAVETLVAIGLWCLFVFGWFRVLNLFPASELVRSLELLASIAVVYGSAIAFWLVLCLRRARIMEREAPQLRPATRAASGDRASAVGTAS